MPWPSFVCYVCKQTIQCFGRHLPDVHAYADDSQLYISFKPDAGADQAAAVTAMQNCIDDVKRWMLADKLKLNDGKTEFILIGTRQQLAKVKWKIVTP